MNQFKEFQGKDIDECIMEACKYFDMPREKLEVEIIQDAKSGIFGIVGARKAKIRARCLHLGDTIQDILNISDETEKKALHSSKNSHFAGLQNERHDNRPQKKRNTESQRQITEPERQLPKLNNKNMGHIDRNLDYEDMPLQGNADSEKLKILAQETLTNLIRPLADRDIEIKLDINHGHVRAKVEWQGDAGLLIGREGQTLAAVQYMASRILSKSMDAAIHVQLEIGDYKSRQDDKLREIAKALAEKARQTGRPWSTRPLSSYHRRIIHMVLQDEPGVLTRSAGDGSQKRVVIFPKRDHA